MRYENFLSGFHTVKHNYQEHNTISGAIGLPTGHTNKKIKFLFPEKHDEHPQIHNGFNCTIRTLKISKMKLDKVVMFFPNLTNF